MPIRDDIRALGERGTVVEKDLKFTLICIDSLKLSLSKKIKSVPWANVLASSFFVSFFKHPSTFCGELKSNTLRREKLDGRSLS